MAATTIERIVEALKNGPLTSGELGKKLKISSGCASGALWRLTKAGVAKPESTERGAPYKLTGKTELPPSKQGGVRTRRRKHDPATLSAEMHITLRWGNGRSATLTLAEANKLYTDLANLFTNLPKGA